jgi:N-methylhydantoinase A
MRYFGQAWEVRVEVPDGDLERAAANEVVQRFHAAHQRTYGYSYVESSDQRIEWVNLRVVGSGPLRRPIVERRAAALSGGAERARTATRPVYFEGDFVETPIYGRAQLQPGDRACGPAIVEEFGSTTVVLPGQCARVDDYRNLLLTRSEE